MVPSERARLRRPGSEEGEARREERNSGWLASGRKPGGVGMNRDGEEPVTLGQDMARLGQVGKRPAESPGKYLQEPTGQGRRRRVSPKGSERSLHPVVRPLSPSARWGLSWGPRGGVR